MQSLSEIAEPRSPLNLKLLFEQGRWQHIIFLTYSFDLPFFETYLLPILIQRGTRSVTVVADANWIAKRLPIWFEREQIRDAGKQYTLCGVNIPGAFHAKVILAANQTSGMALVGSGNLSTFSMTTGGELFTKVEWKERLVPSLAREIWAFYDALSRTVAINERFPWHVQEMSKLAPGLLANSHEPCLCHNLHEPLLDQLVRAVSTHEVIGLFAWAPFADRQLKALKALVEKLRPQKVTLAMQSEITNIDGQLLAVFVNSTPNIQWDFVELQQGTKKQMIHAKGILLTLDTGEDILCTGSPNLSAPALLSTIKQANLETAILLKGQRLKNILFHEDSVVSLKPFENWQSLQWRENGPGPAGEKKREEPLLLGASIEASTLTLNLRDTCPPDALAYFDYSDKGYQIVCKSESYTIPLHNGFFPRIVQLRWLNDQASNEVIIMYMKELRELSQEKVHTPSPSLMSLIYSGDSELLSFLHQLSDILILDPYDIKRSALGAAQPTAEEERKEAEQKGEPIDFSTIDIHVVLQRHRSYLDQTSSTGIRQASSFFWLDEINAYFKKLEDQQLNLAERPELTDSEEEELLGIPQWNNAFEQPRSVSSKIRMLLRNRIRRFINGLRIPEFYQTMPQDWVVANYIRFLNVLEFCWKRKETQGTIFVPHEYGQLCFDLFSAFWGNDAEDGYWSSLQEESAYGAATFLLDNQADALTLAAAHRILNVSGAMQPLAPVTIARLYQAGDTVGLFTPETMERALIYLEQPASNPALLLQKIEQTQKYFSWDRYCEILTKKYQVVNVTMKDQGFEQGKSLMIKSSQDIGAHSYVLAILADWITTSRTQGSHRSIFQMYWNDKSDLLVYNLNEAKLTHKSAVQGKTQVFKGCQIANLWLLQAFSSLLE
ncbi:hypothetical protein KDW_39640 [Dictyobacter vulcani]|uniref:Phospholipase D-like domain-containing protein n=1 Tax=Dictyobacter vulcani TaxID=2607529 RepID=A0A5J4KRQ8_9CHLR|nr:hypothetical protein [Dictyobacter vulcani]GER89802.1 hypothetical protein KDW_39640 [Dictyobacter vulcani]